MMPVPLRLLVIEDAEDDALLLVLELQGGGYAAEFTRVETPDELKAALDDGPWDAIFSDYSLPSFTGLDALRIVQESGLDLPFIIVSGVIGEEQAVEALKAGAHDYLMKGRFARLVSALKRAMKDAVLRHERRQSAEELSRHREHLEELVQERTEELAAANEELQMQSEELQSQSDELIGSLEEIRRVEQELRESREQLRLMVDGIKDYAIFMLDPQGRVLTWNEGAERIKGYRSEEIVGRNFSCFYPSEDIERGRPEHELNTAETKGRFEEEGWRVRMDGSRFWASVLITPLHDYNGNLRGFSKVTRDITERKGAELERERLLASLEASNIELEAFNYTVAHDLRQPLNTIGMNCQAIEMICGDRLHEQCKGFLQASYEGAMRMNRLIGALLNFSCMNRVEPSRDMVDLSALGNEVATSLKQTAPERQVDFRIADGIAATVDPDLLRSVLENLLGNAWKYTGSREEAVIEFGAELIDGKTVYFVRDNGAGFDNADIDKLFVPFQRLPGAEEFRGFGIGLATVERIIRRHGGRMCAEGEPGNGATFYFTLS